MDGTPTLSVDGTELPILIRRSSLARRLSLRLAPGNGGVVVVIPDGLADAQALRFAHEHKAWIAARLLARPQRVELRPGATVPFMGIAHVIRHQPEARRGVWAEAGEILASGKPEHLSRRVETFLKSEARLVLAHRARDLAMRLDRKPLRVTVRDTTSRWGSCSAKGALSFSWRLILAPDWVLEYVVAHEVAHLAEMNHGPRFWALVERLTPHARAARAWLKAQGPDLHRYGR